MEFDSPDVMKDFPGLYASDANTHSNDNDDCEKVKTKDMLIGKKKEKKDKKDKEKGYAALGESSDEESGSKSRRTKAFKFHKNKEKDKDKEKDKKEKVKVEKENVEKKSKSKKNGKAEKEKDKPKKATKVKQLEEVVDIADCMPIFGVSLELAVERGRCHDGIDIPLPVRESIDYIESIGVAHEGVYKISSPRTKVAYIKKLYNKRQPVDFHNYDVPTATGILKAFLRDLPEPIFTNDLLIRFEEAGAILNPTLREKHLRNLIETLPRLNRLLLSWLMVHLRNVTTKEHMNKMNRQSLAAALNHTFHVSVRTLQALIFHSEELFHGVVIFKYIPPLGPNQPLPEKPLMMEIELKKQESLLNQIHNELRETNVCPERQDLLWEVQRIITELKRRLKKAGKPVKQAKEPESLEGEACASGSKEDDGETQAEHSSQACAEDKELEEYVDVETIPEYEQDIWETSTVTLFEKSSQSCSDNKEADIEADGDSNPEYDPDIWDASTITLFGSPHSLEDIELPDLDSDVEELAEQNKVLQEDLNNLEEDVSTEVAEFEKLKVVIETIDTSSDESFVLPFPCKYYDILHLLAQENTVLHIKKMELVRNIVEHREICAKLIAKLNQLKQKEMNKTVPNRS